MTQFGWSLSSRWNLWNLSGCHGNEMTLPRYFRRIGSGRLGSWVGVKYAGSRKWRWFPMHSHSTLRVSNTSEESIGCMMSVFVVHTRSGVTGVSMSYGTVHAYANFNRLWMSWFICNFIRQKTADIKMRQTNNKLIISENKFRFMVNCSLVVH